MVSALDFDSCNRCVVGSQVAVSVFNFLMVGEIWNVFSCANLPSVYCLWCGVCKAASPILINVFH